LTASCALEPTEQDATLHELPQLRAFGSVVSSELVAGVVTERLIATRETLRVVPLLRREIRLSRSEIAGIEFERQWLPPLSLKTVVHFRLLDGRYAPKVYIGRTRKVRAGLRELGWPVEHVQLGAISDRPRRPLRELTNRNVP
jgi:hypothetical protein